MHKLCCKLIFASTLILGYSAESTASEDEWLIGGGVLALTSPYIGVDNQKYALPLINYKGEKLRASIFNLEYNLWQYNRLTLSFATELGEDFLKASDSINPVVNALNDRKISIYSGAKLTYSSAIGIFNTSALYDISGHSEGSIFKANYSYPWRVNNKLTLIPSVGINIKDSDVANYYYGYSNYELDNTTDLTLNLILSYQLTKSLNANAYIRHIALDNDITHSPIINSDQITMAMISIMYKF